MVKISYSKKDKLSLADVVECMKGHLERAGYSVTTSNRCCIGVDLNAEKDKENFIVEVVGDESSSIAQKKEFLSAIGELVRRMKDRSIWTSYGIAIPIDYLKFLKDFEVGGVKLLDFHLFVVETFWSLYHLDSKAVLELIQNLKEGKPESLMYLDIDFKNYDYRI
jgi:hypothetical protein